MVIITLSETMRFTSLENDPSDAGRSEYILERRDDKRPKQWNALGVFTAKEAQAVAIKYFGPLRKEQFTILKDIKEPTSAKF